MNCSFEDEESGKYGYNPDPEGAYRFSLTIKQLVADRDLTGLFKLVPGELRNGPRKRFIEGRTFDQVFTEDWRNEVLASEVSCFPVGLRGFTLGGLVWYKLDETSSPATWKIFSINDAIEEEYKNVAADPAWRVDGRIIPPECLITEWISSENFEAFEETFGIMDVEDFRRNMGQYFGREINRFDPIDPPWEGRKIYLAVLLDDCFFTDAISSYRRRTTLNVDANYVTSGKCYEFDCDKGSYRLLASVSQYECQGLAPHLSGQCKSAYLVKTIEETDGSIGMIYHYNVYGLFSLENGRKAIVPLVNFHFENDARNFLDGFRTRH